MEEERKHKVAYDILNTGYGISTTGTIYGICDMSGGSEQYVVANYNNIYDDTSQHNYGSFRTKWFRCSPEFLD